MNNITTFPQPRQMGNSGGGKTLNFGLWWSTIRDIPPCQLAARVEFEEKSDRLR